MYIKSSISLLKHPVNFFLISHGLQWIKIRSYDRTIPASGKSQKRYIAPGCRLAPAS